MKYLINGETYSSNSLHHLCREKINQDKTPDWESDLYKFINEWISGLEIFTLKTSGSTGRPKPIEFKRLDMITSAKRTIDYFNLNQGDSILLALPIRYIAGKMVVVRALVGGLDLIIQEPSNDPIPNMNRPTIDFCSLVPYQVHHIIKNGSGLERLRKVLIGGASISKNLREKLKGFDSLFYESYGMTETLSHVAIRQVSPVYEKNFRCLKGITVRTGENGTLIFSGDSLPVSPVITNDIGSISGPNEFNLLGRIDNIINSGGIKISPESIEKVMEEVLPGRTIIVAGEKHQTLGERLVMVIEGEELSRAEAKNIKDVLGSLKTYERPQRYYLTSEFPRSENGKIQRQMLNLENFRMIEIYPVPDLN